MPRGVMRRWTKGDGWYTYLDGVNGADGDPGDGHAGKDVAADLEGTHGEGSVQDCAGGGTEPSEADEGGHEEGTVGGDEEELDKGEGYGVAELVHDGFSGVGGHCGGCIPDAALEDEAEDGGGGDEDGCVAAHRRWRSEGGCRATAEGFSDGAEAWREPVVRPPLVISRGQEKWKMPENVGQALHSTTQGRCSSASSNWKPYRELEINRESRRGCGSPASSSMALSEHPPPPPRPSRRSWGIYGPRPGSSGSGFSSLSSDSKSFFSLSSLSRKSSTCTLTQPQQEPLTPPKTPTPPGEPTSPRRRRMSVRSMMGALSIFPSNDAASDKERGRSWSKRDKTPSAPDDSAPDSRASSRSRSSSPFVFRRTRTRDPSPAVGALKTDVDSDYEPSTRIRPRNAFSAHDDDETSGDETECYDDSDESWSDDHFDPVTERNTETNAALTSPPVNEEGAFADPLGEGVNVVIPPEPYFPSTLNGSTHQPRRRKSTKSHVHDRLSVVTSRPVFQRDRCSIKLVQGDPDAALEKRKKRTYMLLSDLSDESRYALEWGIGTVIRDGDELYVMSLVLLSAAWRHTPAAQNHRHRRREREQRHVGFPNAAPSRLIRPQSILRPPTQQIALPRSGTSRRSVRFSRFLDRADPQTPCSAKAWLTSSSGRRLVFSRGPSST